MTEVADDLKARNAVLRQFPEVELIVGKAGRADTPTDPSPFEMVETIINLRPKEFWPKRKLEYETPSGRPASSSTALGRRGLMRAPDSEADRKAILDRATMTAIGRMDGALREFVLQRYASLKPSWRRDWCAISSPNWCGVGERRTGC